MKNNQGIMSGIMNMFSGPKVANNASNKKEVNSSVMNRGFTATLKGIQAGGSGSQPSEAVMQWATTAGIPTPPPNMLKGVAHGGARKKHTRRHKQHKRRHTKKHNRTQHKRK